MLYYTTSLYLQQVLEMISIHFNALIDTYHHILSNFLSVPSFTYHESIMKE